MDNRLYWQRLLPLRWNDENIVVFRCTTGDSEFVNRSKEVFRLLCRPTPWDVPDDATGNMFDVYGEVPDVDEEPGRIVFTIPKSDAKRLNPKHGRYYCRLLSRENDITKEWKTEFMGFFEVIKAGDKFNKEEIYE